ncbi:ATP-grasp domain-containing protein [Brytella acorum]|uniref:ATP-grasp domain-containing protein n=1 Tax=Brytella acorum TaxID=2959299 RepID=A0AA35UGQ0_9PROT|nr:ATP-grasp domain-containing protein [Brytella acorum]MDF3624474.1 ATP-grasp domain-containing protein [Brytella acorum]CAI9119676.1 ATP-grasp domain-containing protein [Brytella acorum]
MLQIYDTTEDLNAPEPDADATAHPLSLFEFWPGSVFYTPIVLYWIAMGIRYGDFSIPSAANPHIETGGLCGERKTDILDLAGPLARQWIAPYIAITLDKRHREQDEVRARTAMKDAGIGFPVVVKPDIGCNGTGVKLVRHPEDLASVLAQYPGSVRIVLQKLIDRPIEAGIFYIRHPDEANGRITSITYKDVPHVMGDGVSSIEQLIMRDRRMSLVPEIYLPRLGDRRHHVPAPGQRVELVFTGNHCKGSVFRDGRADTTPELTARLDALIKDIPDFHFGRIDVKADSIDALKRGEDFEIIEINGVGSEATHIWDRRTTLWEAYRAQFEHYSATFRIGAANRARGWKTCGAFTMLRAWRKQRRMLASYPLND